MFARPMLSVRLRRTLIYRFSLFPPAVSPAPDATLTLGGVSFLDPEAPEDDDYAWPPKYANVPGQYVATPDYEVESQAGLIKETNLFTADKFNFPQGQEVGTGWLIVMTGCPPPPTPPHPYLGRAWVAQGNGSVNADAPGRSAGILQIYANLAPTGLIPSAP